MSYENTLNEEIDAIINAKLANGEVLHPAWIAQQVCAAHESGLTDGDDKLFWLHAGYLVARKAVLDRVRRIAGTAAERAPTAPTLPGFDHLQTHYIVCRDGDEIAIPTEQCSDAELDAIAARIDAMAETCKAHAREVRRYKRLRARVA